MPGRDSATVTVPDIGVPGCRDAVEIGRGGFGVVYRARQPAFSRTVAVKVLAADRLDEAARRRFEREIQAMGRLSGHPHIVTVHQAGFTTAGNPYILMAYEEGGSLASRGPAGSWQEAVAGGIAVVGALESAHRAGILHRDVKPGNILISRYGDPKLADFGLARPVGRGTARPGTVTASLVHAAPEVLHGSTASVPADVYALASTVFWWLTGAPVFPPGPREPAGAVLARIAAGPVPDLRPLGVPEAVCRALERALAKDPAARHGSVAAFAEELQEAQRAAGSPVTPLLVGDAGAGAGDGEAGVPGPVPVVLSSPGGELSATVASDPPPRRRIGRAAGAVLALAAVLATVAGSEAVGESVALAAPARLDFGSQETAVEPQEAAVTVRNRGSRPALLPPVTAEGADFRVVADGCSGHALVPDAACELRVAFSPAAAGSRLGALRLPGRTVVLAGTGVLPYATEDDPPPGRCYADAYQVGHSAYGYVGGQKAISVKQYWSPGCRAVMAYAWVWKQYRDNAGPDGIWSLALTAGHDRPARAGGQPLELWTAPLPAPAGCTRAGATMTGTGLTAPLVVTTDAHCP